jgi:hypothetical protein
MTVIVCSCAFVAAVVASFAIPYWLTVPERQRENRFRSSVDSALAVPRTWPPITIHELGSAVATLRTTCEASRPFMGTLKYDLQLVPADSIISRLRRFSFEPSRLNIVFFGADGFKSREIVVDAAQLTHVTTGDGHQALVSNDAAGSCDDKLLDYRSWNITWSLPPAV